MKIKVLVLLLLVFWSASVTRSIEIFPFSLSVEEGQGFVLWVVSENITLDSCELRFGKDLLKTDATASSSKYGTVEKVVTTNPKECAFRVKHVTMEASGTWAIHFFIDGLDQADTVQVTVLKKIDGGCPTGESEYSSCELYNTKTGDTIPCENNLNLTSGGNSSDWTCKYFTRSSMEAKVEGKVSEAVQSDTSADLEWDSDSSNAVVFDQEDLGTSSVMLTCASGGKKVSSCTAKHISSGRLFDLQPGLQSSDKKFSTYSTSLMSGHCQLEIVKPIALQDIGPWELSMTGSDKKCSFIVRPQITETVAVNTMGPLVSITCAKDLGYPLRRCYIQSLDPNSKIEFKSSMDLRNGLCQFERPSEGKEFYCGFNAPNASDKDIITQFKVVKHEYALIEANVLIQGKFGFAEVSEINGDPIAHCLIMEPNGRLFSLAADQQADDKMPYSELAPGLEKGHCGIRFHVNPDNEDEGGVWNFNVQMNDGRELSLSYTLNAPESSD